MVFQEILKAFFERFFSQYKDRKNDGTTEISERYKSESEIEDLKLKY